MQKQEKWLVVGVLILQAGLLASLATHHSPVVDEVGHLPAGLSHWKLHRFDLYNVNPPLIRTLATAPLQVLDVPIDFSGYRALPQHRSEFGIGSRWISAHPDSFPGCFAVARWACIPFSLLGAVTCYTWARELYGPGAGWLALCLWCFCPNILAYGSLITPDAGAAAVGVTACFVFRKWLIHRTTGWAIGAGLMLGLTLLTKFTWLFLLGLWPLVWILLRCHHRTIQSIGHAPGQTETRDVAPREQQQGSGQPGQLPFDWRSDLGHPGLIALLALWVLNSGYLFENSFQRLGDFQFFSQSLSGQVQGIIASEGNNRFRGTWLEHLPLPIPGNFLQGIDHIKWEYEQGYPSYLRGIRRKGGWWYYYLYAMLVKMPAGTLVLIVVATGMGVFNHRGPARITEVVAPTKVVPGNSETRRFSVCSAISVVKAVFRLSGISSAGSGQDTRRADLALLAEAPWFDTFFLLAPVFCTLWLVSSQTGFNHHLRYVLPAFPFLFICASRTALLLNSRHAPLRVLPVACVAWMISSSLSVYPHSLSYFNELAGGPKNGWKHLDNSNIDWGQDMGLVREWVEQHPDAKPLYIEPSGFVSAEQMRIRTSAFTNLHLSRAEGIDQSAQYPPGWYIVGLTRLVDPTNPLHALLHREPDDYIGYSMRIYHVPPSNQRLSDKGVSPLQVVPSPSIEHKM